MCVAISGLHSILLRSLLGFQKACPATLSQFLAGHVHYTAKFPACCISVLFIIEGQHMIPVIWKTIQIYPVGSSTTRGEYLH